MNAQILRGHICTSKDENTIEITENGYLVVDGASCLGVFSELPEQYRRLPVTDFGDRLILPGMSDLHLHAPQFSFRGLGMDMELLDWLNTYTFPEEAKYRDLPYADGAYESLTRHLRQSTTTRVCVFGTIHVPATELLMGKLDRAGLRGFVGKVNMDRNSPDYLRETSVDRALAETEHWICETQERFEGIKPILTPRFIPTCSDELMRGLRRLLEKYKLPVQSHLSENHGEIEWVRELCPTADFYGEAYDSFGMFGGDHACVMAHCVHSGEAEIELMKKNGVFIAHSPESNMNLASGIAPVSVFLAHGMNAGLATDLAGGSHESMLRAMMHAIQASKMRWRFHNEEKKPLSFDQAFYLATAGGGAFFGKVGRFEPGYELDAVVMDDGNLDHPQYLPVRSRLERMIYLADERNVYAKYVAGKKLF